MPSSAIPRVLLWWQSQPMCTCLVPLTCLECFPWWQLGWSPSTFTCRSSTTWVSLAPTSTSAWGSMKGAESVLLAYSLCRFLFICPWSSTSLLWLFLPVSTSPIRSPYPDCLLAVTGVSVIKISIVISTICVFYTTIGGLKAVVWTDAIQFSITIGASVLVFFLGLKSVGGFAEVVKTAHEGNRLDVFEYVAKLPRKWFDSLPNAHFSFDASLTKRETFWAIIIGLTVHWVAHMSINQGCTQKFLSVPTYK